MGQLLYLGYLYRTKGCLLVNFSPTGLCAFLSKFFLIGVL